MITNIAATDKSVVFAVESLAYKSENRTIMKQVWNVSILEVTLEPEL